MREMLCMYNPYSNPSDNESPSSLEYILLSDKWNTDKVTYSKDMFRFCSKLPEFRIDAANDITMLSTYCWNIDNDITIDGYTLHKDNYWGTLCLPFSVTTFEGTSLEGVTLRELDAENSHLTDGVLTLKFKEATTIEAGKPYLVKWNSGSNITIPTFAGGGTSSVAPQAVEFANNDGGTICQFVGQFS